MVQVHILALLLSDPYYARVGEIVVRWAALEHQLQHIIWRAMGLDNKQGRMLTVGMSTQTLTRILRSLPKRWITDETVEAHVSGLLKEVDKLVGMRNSLVHGMWSVDPAKPEEKPWLNYIKTADERILPSAEQVTPELLADFAQNVAVLNQVANLILKAIGGEQDGELPLSPEPS